MSYEGRREFLCENGHYHVVSFEVFTYMDWPDGVTFSEKLICNHCGGKLVWEHEIDDTNGYDKDDPNTFEALKEKYGYTDVECVDHRGNVYYTQLWKYRPADGSTWELISVREERDRRREEDRKANMRYIL